MISDLTFGLTRHCGFGSTSDGLRQCFGSVPDERSENKTTVTITSTRSESDANEDNEDENENENKNNEKEYENDDGTVTGLKQLPPPTEISKKLSKLAVTESREQALIVLKELRDWLEISDIYPGDRSLAVRDYLVSYGGVLNILDFIQRFPSDGKCIDAATDVLCQLLSEDGRGIADFMEYDGLQTLIQSSDVCIDGNNEAYLEGALFIWIKLEWILSRHLRFGREFSKDSLLSLLDSALFTLAKLKGADGPTAQIIRPFIFDVLFLIIDVENVVTKEVFDEKDVQLKILDLFKKDGAWTFGDDVVRGKALRLFLECRKQDLIPEDSDYEQLLPMLVGVLKESSLVHAECVLDLLMSALDANLNKDVMEKSGVVEVLGLMLKSEQYPDGWKTKAREILRIVLAP